jgi:uncharacterized membrane protein YhaH (DUF805 family)
MTPALDFTRLRRLTLIYVVVQVLLVIMLALMALKFQAELQAEGRPQRFLHSVVVALVVQLAIFYPVNRFAAKEAEREVAGCAPGLTTEQLKAQRTRRLSGDLAKMAVFIFFATFIYRAPKDTFILSVLYYSFVLTTLSYFQCFNFAARRLMRGQG